MKSFWSFLRRGFLLRALKKGVSNMLPARFTYKFLQPISLKSSVIWSPLLTYIFVCSILVGPFTIHASGCELEDQMGGQDRELKKKRTMTSFVDIIHDWSREYTKRKETRLLGIDLYGQHKKLRAHQMYQDRKVSTESSLQFLEILPVQSECENMSVMHKWVHNALSVDHLRV